MKISTFKLLHKHKDDEEVSPYCCLVYFLTDKGISKMAVEINESDSDLLNRENKSDFITWIVVDEWADAKYSVPEKALKYKEVGLSVLSSMSVMVPDIVKLRVKADKGKLHDIILELT